jgi:hypothetical protein
MTRIDATLELNDTDLDNVCGGMNMDGVRRSENVIDCRGQTPAQCTETMKKFDEQKKLKEAAKKASNDASASLTSTAFG